MIIGRQLFRAQNVRLLFCEICSRATVRPFEGRSVAALLLGLAEVLFFGTGLTAQSPPLEWHSTFELQSDRNVQGGLQAAWARAQLEDAQATLEAARAAKDLGAEADTLNEIAGLYFTMSEFQKALAYLDLALPTYRKVGNRA